MPAPPPSMRMSAPAAVDACLLDDRLQPPPAPPSLGTGATRALRDRMARFSSGAAHADARAEVERLLSSIDEGVVQERLDEAVANALPVPGAGPLDAHAVAAVVPTIVLAGALGWSAHQVHQAAEDVSRLAQTIGRGAAVDAHTDQATERLLSTAASLGHDPDAAVSALYQNRDATQSLILRQLEAELSGASRTPAVTRTVRVATEAIVLTAGDDDVRNIAGGSIVELDLTAGSREFGHGPHACPGRALAERIATGVCGQIIATGWTALPDIEEGSSGSIVAFQLWRGEGPAEERRPEPGPSGVSHPNDGS